MEADVQPDGARHELVVMASLLRLEAALFRFDIRPIFSQASLVAFRIEMFSDEGVITESSIDVIE